MNINDLMSLSQQIYNLTLPNPVSFEKVYDNLFQAFTLKFAKHLAEDPKYEKLLEKMSLLDFTKISQDSFEKLLSSVEGLTPQELISNSISETVQAYASALKPLLSQEKQSQLALINLN